MALMCKGWLTNAILGACLHVSICSRFQIIVGAQGLMHLHCIENTNKGFTGLAGNDITEWLSLMMRCSFPAHCFSSPLPAFLPLQPKVEVRGSYRFIFMYLSRARCISFPKQRPKALMQGSCDSSPFSSASLCLPSLSPLLSFPLFFPPWT